MRDHSPFKEIPLLKIQRDFRDGVLNHKKKTILQQIRENHISSAARLNIYRNTIVQNLRNALELTFPCVWKLVGKECADNLAYAFVHERMHLPTSNCLDDWGGEFPLFLQNFKPISDLSYLKDVAMIEWLEHLSYCAADYKILNPHTLKKHLNTRIEGLRVIFNPSVFLYTSCYSVQTIFDLLYHPEDRSDSNIHVQSKPNFALIARKNNQVMVHWLQSDLFYFLNDIHNKLTLTQAYENTLARNPEFNLVEALKFVLKAELLHNCRYTH